MKKSLVIAIVVFIASLAAFGSGIVSIIGALASAAWIVYVLRRFDRAEVIEVEEAEQRD
jgi:ABC-type dipeptide/oligopeptide/nickel transport system permease subunit